MNQKATTTVNLGGKAKEEEVPEPTELEEELVEDGVDEDEDENVQIEDLDPDLEIWPGGPTAGQILEWKEQHGDVYVSHMTPDTYVVWRTIRRGEYRNHVKNIEALSSSGQYSPAEADMISEESIAQMCTLFPTWDVGVLSHASHAGLASKLAEDIMQASGFMSFEVRKL